MTFVFTFIVAKKIINFQFLPHVLPAFVSSILMGIVVLAIDQLPHSLFTFLLAALVGGCTYVGVLTFIFHKNIVNDIRNLLKYD